MIGDWLQLLGAALGGGLVVKLLDIAYQEYRSRSMKSKSARAFVDSHLVPLIKVADELVGKLRSLAMQDFQPLHDTTDLARSKDLQSTVYLLSKFWAQIEVFRTAGLTVEFVRDERGRTLQTFIDCLESRRVRLQDRISQRALGELMLSDQAEGLDLVRFLDFALRQKEHPLAQEWVGPLVDFLSRTRHTTERQRLMAYGIVVHALVDTLDPKHALSRERPSYPRKLSRKTWRDLRYRIFARYLTVVDDSSKYIGPPK